VARRGLLSVQPDGSGRRGSRKERAICDPRVSRGQLQAAVSRSVAPSRLCGTSPKTPGPSKEEPCQLGGAAKRRIKLRLPTSLFWSHRAARGHRCKDRSNQSVSDLSALTPAGFHLVTSSHAGGSAAVLHGQAARSARAQLGPLALAARATQKSCIELQHGPVCPSSLRRVDLQTETLWVGLRRDLRKPFAFWFPWPNPGPTSPFRHIRVTEPTCGRHRVAPVAARRFRA
jgi:hypothetical protein